ncbi:predicted protein [Histoplasma capsulatum var. duboisii H88]|uniref:Predicted protein n=1 Tax=Ajellomyces capsulatus (strain H88) TaxID=544711 RepID=F0UL07_AJEC8|nr:predicted protein [Histoplasma capsulatum var. duboisii H88]
MEGLTIQIPVKGKRLTCALPSTSTTKEFSRTLNVQVGKVVDLQNVFPRLLAYMLDGPDLQGYWHTSLQIISDDISTNDISMWIWPAGFKSHRKWNHLATSDHT